MSKLSLYDRFFAWAYESVVEFKVLIISASIIVFFMALSVFSAFNHAGPPINTVNGVVENIRHPRSPTIETNAGGYIAKVRLASGIITRVTIANSPIPEVGDSIKLTLHKNALSGDHYKYAGKNKKPI